MFKIFSIVFFQVFFVCCVASDGRSVNFEDILLSEITYEYKSLPIRDSVVVVEEMFIDALGGQESYDYIEVVNLGNRKITDISPDMIDRVARGVKDGRKFIAYKQEDTVTGRKGVEVFYQRYTDDETIWLNGGKHALRYLFPVNRGVVTRDVIVAFAKFLHQSSLVDRDDLKFDYDNSCFSSDFQSSFDVNDLILQRLQDVVRKGFSREHPDDIKFLENGDNQIFILTKLAPDIIFKYYLRDHNGYYAESWFHNAQFAKEICELFELDLLIVPEAKLIKMHINGENFAVLAKERIIGSESGADLYNASGNSLNEMFAQLTTFMFKTGIGSLDHNSLPLINNGFDKHGNQKTVLTNFEEMNLGIINKNLLQQLFDMTTTEKHKKIIEQEMAKHSFRG